ncbi:MAG: ABC transporter permease [Microbacterium sp.]|uniref:ABC transporter permease n=1 Tax=Microbacterium sp. TaxID=51671 RepID=UPI003A83B819
MSLAAASRAEFTKTFSTAGWWILAIVLVVYVGSTAAGLGAALAYAVSSGDTAATGMQGIDASVVGGVTYSLSASIGYVFPLLIGTLMVTTEFRHKTLTPTFLATPRRGTVLWAKVIIGIVVGALFAVLSLIATVGPGAAFLAGFGIETGLGSSDTWAMFGRIGLALILWTIVGLGVGSLVRNQVAAIVIVLAFTQFIEPVARVAANFVDGLGGVTNYLPGAASDALVGFSIFSTVGGTGGAATPVEWWVGGLVLAGYAAVLLVLGQLFSWRRDVS